jgi:putative radical SAM enzyme (TIGR03279 family)
MAVRISSVITHSPASHHFIKAGDKLISVNGHEIRDVLDYQFYIDEQTLELVIEKPNGKRRTVKMKDVGGETGMEFETYLMDKQRSCANNCIFCFIDQLPKNLRESLYFKDDDSRLSFLFGNYITLTNIGERDIDRIIEMHISPVNISVHTMNPELRIRMMKNKRAGKVLEYVKKLALAGVKLNTQLVLCPGYNDGEELTYTLEELGKLYPSVQSIAAVPVGLTCYRDGLENLDPFTKEQSFDVISRIDSYNSKFMCYNNMNIAYAADEFYLNAGLPMPDCDRYGDFPQLENGVGLWSLLKSELETALNDIKDDFSLPKMRRITMATGVAAYPLIEYIAESVQKKVKNIQISVIKIDNKLFGERITVAGLLCGTDIGDGLDKIDLGDELLIPGVSLRREGDLFLDDVSIDELSQRLNIKVTPVQNDGQELLQKILGEQEG